MVNANGTVTLDKYLHPTNRPFAQGTLPLKQTPWQWAINQQIQSKRIVTSQINIKKALGLSSVSVSTFSIGTGVNSQQELTTTLINNAPHNLDSILAIPYISLYQQVGTSTFLGTGQIYPIVGNSVAIGAYTVQSGFNFHPFYGNGTAPFSLALTNNGTVSQNIVFVSQWQYFNYNSGTLS